MLIVIRVLFLLHAPPPHANWNWNLTFGSGSEWILTSTSIYVLSATFVSFGFVLYIGIAVLPLVWFNDVHPPVALPPATRPPQPCKQFTELESQSRQETTRALAETRELKAERDKSLRDVHTAQLEAQSWRQEVAGCKAAVSIVLLVVRWRCANKYVLSRPTARAG